MSLTSVKTVAALIVGGAAALGLIALYRGAGREAAPTADAAHAAHELALSTRSASPDDVRSGHSAPGTPATAPAGPSSSEQALARQADLRGASESFRNSTLLIAIRESGFVCNDLMSADQSADSFGGWRVACRGALTYFVAVGASGELVVQPVPMGDGLIVSPFERFPPDQLPNPQQRPPNR
jgi:hypothetical protein